MRLFAGRRHEGLSARVGRGAALLDEKYPGWELLVELDRLDIGSPATCVLGQLTGFRCGGEIPTLSFFGMKRHGFDATLLSAFLGRSREQYTMLEKLWAAEIIRRRSEREARRLVTPPRVAANPVLV